MRGRARLSVPIVAVLQLFLLRAADSAAPLIVCPATVAAGQTSHCFVSQTSGAAAPAKLDLVAAAATKNVLAEAKPSTQSAGLYTMVVPKDLAPGEYLVLGDGGAKAGVTIKAPAALVMMESDKALYKPGQTARFRVLALSADKLLPLASASVDFEVVSPEGFKLMTLAGTTDTAGVARFEFPIASEPLLGDHGAQATVTAAGGGAASQQSLQFTIDEYVLPRFEVNLTVDQKTVYIDQNNPKDEKLTLTGKVSGLFTFGEAVEGIASVAAWSPTSNYGGFSGGGGGVAVGGDVAVGFAGPENVKVAAEDIKDGGSGSGSGGGGAGVEHKALATVSGLKVSGESQTTFELPIPKSSLRYGTSLTIEATLISAATGEKQSATQTVFVAYSGRDLRVHLEKLDGQRTFQPQLPFKVRVKLTKLDGTPPSKSDLSGYQLIDLVAQPNVVDYKKREQAPTMRSSFQIDAAGVAEVELTPSVGEEASCCDVMAKRTTYEEYRTVCGCCVTSYNIYIEVQLSDQKYKNRLYSDGKDVSNLCLNRAYSPTGGYIALDNVDANSGSATILSTVNPQDINKTAEYILVRGGAVVGGGLTSLLQHSSEKGYWKMKTTMTLPDGISGGIHVFLAATPLKGQGQLTAKASLSKTLQLPFSLSAGFREKEVLPGAAVTVELKAGAVSSGKAPNNLHAFVTSVDRSVELLGARTAINKDAVMQSLEAADSASKEPAVAAQPWKECNKGVSMLASELPDTLTSVKAESTELVSDKEMSRNYGEQEYPCARPLQSDCYLGGGGGGLEMDDVAFDGGAPVMMAGAPESVNKGQDASSGASAPPAAKETDEEASSGGTTVKTRKFFPETWIWSDLDVDPSGSTMSLVAPDTITSWTLEAFATCDEGLSAVKAEVPLKVFKPFFVEMRLPYSAVRGEELDVTFAVFNYIEGSGTVVASLKLTLPPELEVSGNSSSSNLELTIAEGTAASTVVRIRPKKLGSWTISAMASTTTGTGTSTDAMEKQLLVKPEGIPMTETKNIVVDLTGGKNSLTDTMILELPEDAIADSARLSVSVVGDLLGPTLGGLERLIRIPSGCGEQNMISLAPNVYVAKYLQSVGKLSPKLRKRLVNNMIVGYGRELTYRHPDGSFSAFGKSDKEGSTWLTAFVLRVFAEVQGTKLVTVDTDVLAKAASFLVDAQEKDGSFRAIGKVIHTEMTGGASKGVALSAYVTSALAKARAEVPALGSRVSGLASALDKAKNYLIAQESAGTYSSLLRAHALGLAGLWSEAQVADEALRTSQTTEGRRWWTPDAVSTDEATTKMRYGRPARAQDVELTGYGVLALTLANRLTEAFEGARWLLEKRSATGGFMSTQDTVVGLNALATYASAVMAKVDVSIGISDGQGFSETLRVDSSNVDVLQTVALPKPGLPVKVDATGSGIALSVAEIKYNLPKATAPPCFDVEAEWFGDLTSKPVTGVKACVIPRKDCSNPQTDGMSILSVGLFTGFEAIVATLDDLKERRATVKRWELGDARVDLYMEDLSREDATCVEFMVSKIYEVRNIQPALSECYEYYAPDNKGQTLSTFAMRPLQSPLDEDGFKEVLEANVGNLVDNSKGGTTNAASRDKDVAAAAGWRCFPLVALSIAWAVVFSLYLNYV